MSARARDELLRSPHRIGRVRFEVDASGVRSSLALRTALVDGAETWIPQAFDTACEALDTAGRTLHLDRLEITIDRLDGERLLPQRLVDALREALAARLAHVRDTERAYDTGDERDTLAHAFAAFLETGRLPWWSPVVTVGALETQVQALDDSARALLARAIAPILLDTRSAYRLAVQIAPRITAAIVAALPSAAAMPIGASDMRDALTAANRDPFAAATMATIARIQMAAVASTDAARNPSAKSVEAPLTAHPESSRSAGIDELLTPDRAAASVAAEPRLTAAWVDSAVIVANAGLVLIHPFVRELFAARGLTTAHAFTDLNAQARAVQLLAFIASGHDEYPETDLLLAKLLCAMAPHEPLPRSSLLLSGDREEAAVMLRAVIEHWGALGQASAEALRETFLLRPGRLQDTTPAWRLSVQPRGADALLARLPWTLGIVRLPWMPRPIHVGWS